MNKSGKNEEENFWYPTNLEIIQDVEHHLVQKDKTIYDLNGDDAIKVKISVSEHVFKAEYIQKAISEVCRKVLEAYR